jgi:chromate transporter
MAGISAGQITPGPILISSAFFGYKLSGIPGAIIATVAIFFPSSVVMILVSKFFVQVRANRFVQSALAGIKPAVVGLITAAAISIFADYGQLDNSIVFFMTMLISFLLFFRFKVNPAIVVVISGVIGYFVYSS